MTEKTKKLSQSELREEITQRIVEAMSRGLPPWREPYRRDPNSGFPTNVISSKRYTGINTLLLAATAMEREYTSKWWGTYNQWHAMGAQVKKRPANVREGEWGTKIVFYRRVEPDEVDAKGEAKRYFFVLRSFTVFNVEQVEGDHLSMFRAGRDSDLEDRFLATLTYDHVDEMVEATRAKFDIGPEPKYLYPPADKIIMPKKALFVDLRNYYATKFHEMIHWTEPRLGWPGKRSHLQGADLEAMGELIAEIGTCYLETELQIPHSDDMTNHHKYIQTWLRVLLGDPRRIFEASHQATKAVDFLLAFSRPVSKKEDQ